MHAYTCCCLTMFACRDDKETRAKPARYRRTNDIIVTIFYLEYYFLQLWLRPILLLSCRSQNSQSAKGGQRTSACSSSIISRRKLSRIVRFESQSPVSPRRGRRHIVALIGLRSIRRRDRRGTIRGKQTMQSHCAEFSIRLAASGAFL